MLDFKSTRRRLTRIGVIVVLVTGSIVPGLFYAPAAHAAQVTSRFIELGNSAASATDVLYTVSFKAATTQTVKGIVVQICDNSPLVNTTCTAPTGFSSNYGGLVIANQAGISGFALAAATNGGTSNTNTIILTKAAGSSLTGGTTVVSFDLGSSGASDGITNPSTTNHTFYARIVTYGGANGDTDAEGYLDTNIDIVNPHTDDGGVAISTANTITITAKVQETLTFCVYTGVNCAAGGSAVALGDVNGVLSNTALVYTDSSSKFDLATNASAGAVVRMKGDTLKTTGGTFSIDPHGATCTADSVSTALEQFGVRVDTTAQTPLAAVAPYNCSTTNHTFDVTNTNTTYGQAIADTGGGALDVKTGTMEFAAKSALTTEAGIYTTTLIFIATATY